MSATHDTPTDYSYDARPTDELIAVVLTKNADLDDEGYWQPIKILQHRVPRILARVQELGNSHDEKRRDTAAAILGQCSLATKFDPELCSDLLLRMLAQERSSSVLTSIIFALGQLHDPRMIEPLVLLSTHPDARVRYAVVSSLGGHDDSRAIEAMIACSADQDSDVRNWATFGLGSLIERDNPAIREALFARLEEQEDEIRGEALVGLARRGDSRVVAPLLKELAALKFAFLPDGCLAAEAAEAVVAHANASGSKEWQPVLDKLATLAIVK